MKIQTELPGPYKIFANIKDNYDSNIMFLKHVNLYIHNHKNTQTIKLSEVNGG